MTSPFGRPRAPVIITLLIITPVMRIPVMPAAIMGTSGLGTSGGASRLTDFQRDLLFLLHDLGRLLRVDADKRARTNGMTRAQWGILLWLDREPGISQKELGELLEVEPISVARLVDRLEARSMVERRPDPKDRRIWRLHLCPAAHPALHEIHRHRAAMARRLTAGIDPATLDTMA